MERFYKIAKLSIVAFIIAVLMIVFYGCTASDVEEIELPLILWIYSIVSAILFVICIFIGIVLDIIENCAKDRAYGVKYLMQVIVCWFAIVIADDSDWSSINWISSVSFASGVVYVLRKEVS